METGKNPITGNQGQQQDPEAFEPDTQKIVHKHLQDENHVITEEEMKSIKITTEHFDAEHKKMLDEVVSSEEKQKKSDDDIVTPWDVTS